MVWYAILQYWLVPCYAMQCYAGHNCAMLFSSCGAMLGASSAQVRGHCTARSGEACQGAMYLNPLHRITQMQQFILMNSTGPLVQFQLGPPCTWNPVGCYSTVSISSNVVKAVHCVHIQHVPAPPVGSAHKSQLLLQSIFAGIGFFCGNFRGIHHLASVMKELSSDNRDVQWGENLTIMSLKILGSKNFC